MEKEIFDTIHRRIKYIWEERIKEDYELDWLYRESTLKSALYHHIRTECSDLFQKEDIRLFTEFTDDKFNSMKCRPDLVIAKVDSEKGKYNYYSEAIGSILAVFEIKFISTEKEADRVYADYKKLEEYINNGIDAHLYMVTIWECEDDDTSWIRKNAKWAKGRVTELNALIKKKSDWETQFYVFEHGKKEVTE